MFAMGILLTLSSAPLWLMFIANGIAYGSIYGLSGREKDLQTFAFRAETALISAVLVQATGTGLLTAMFTTRLPSIAGNTALRLSFPALVGLLSALLVFVLIRGL